LMSSRRGSEIATDEIAAGGMIAWDFTFFGMTLFSRTLAVLRRRSGLRGMMLPAIFSVLTDR
jgi:hypothetical protein